MGYRWIEHTAELELQIEAASEAAVCEEALLALAELLGDGSAGEPLERRVTLEARDRPTLLAAWVDELVYLAETDDLVPERAPALELAGNRLTATVAGRRAAPPHFVKAATYHRLSFEPGDGGFRATVVLDV